MSDTAAVLVAIISTAGAILVALLQRKKRVLRAAVAAEITPIDKAQRVIADSVANSCLYQKLGTSCGD